MAGQPIDDPIEGDTIALDRLLPDLKAPRTLIVSGKRMRVAVLSSVDIVAADGVSTVPLQVGDSLLLEADAGDAAHRRAVWMLTDKNGFTGTVTLASESASADDISS